MKKIILLACCLLVRVFATEPEYPKMGPDIYDPKSDGAKEIAAALTRAQGEHKNVLLVFGANWCPWCRRLHQTFETDATVKQTLQDNYVLVLVDVNMRHGEKRNAEVNTRYGNPIKEGLPVLVVLDAAGKALVTQESGILEDGKDGHDPAKVTAFLKQWAPKR